MIQAHAIELTTSEPVALAMVAAFWLLSAVLLWLGGTLASNGRSCAWPLSWALLGAGAAVNMCALWVPMALLPTLSGAPLPTPDLVAIALLASTLSCMLVLAGWWLKRKMMQQALLVLPIVAIETISLYWVATPWNLPASSALGGITLLLLMALHTPHVSRLRHHRSVRIACALVASGLVVWACKSGCFPCLSATAGAVSASMTLTALSGMALMSLMAFALIVLIQQVPLRELGLAHDSHRRPFFSDALTRLPTRTFLEKRMASIAKKCDERKTRMALLFIDLDGFKPVNDTFGHGYGDAILQQVGKRLRLLARSGHAVARVGGDEFMLLLRDIDSDEDVALLARRLIKHLSQPYQVEQQELTISCSIGIVTYPDYGDLSKLIARSDAAMYAAKRSGGACYCFYSPTMDADTEKSFELLRNLRDAVEHNSFELFYQPKINVRSGKVTAVEALIRWQDNGQGVILPSVFIPVAERFGLMGSMGDWVIEDACRQIHQWRDEGLKMPVAINLSAIQLRQKDLAQRISDALQRHRVDPAMLTCEITESAAMEDTQITQETLQHLGRLGVHISIDDFGTGHSSLSYLRQLPAEELKIDRSFIVDIDCSTDARAVVDAVVKLAHALGLRVVAEGVENTRQQEVLIALGCDELQGFLYAPPMSAHKVLQAYLKSEKSEPVADASTANGTDPLFSAAQTRPST